MAMDQSRPYGVISRAMISLPLIETKRTWSWAPDAAFPSQQDAHWSQYLLTFLDFCKGIKAL